MYTINEVLEKMKGKYQHLEVFIKTDNRQYSDINYLNIDCIRYADIDVLNKNTNNVLDYWLMSLDDYKNTFDDYLSFEGVNGYVEVNILLILISINPAIDEYS